MILKKNSIIAWQMLPGVAITKALISSGFDALVIDLEHTSMDLAQAEPIIALCNALNTPPLVRLESPNPLQARKALDLGAAGIIIPVIESKTQLEDFSQHCYYPPHGIRGTGLVPANLWGNSLDHYYNNFQPTIIAQVETTKGADNINNILQAKHLDGILLGPYDLSASLNIPGQFNDPRFIQAVNSIKQSTQMANKFIGIHQVIPDQDALQQRINEDFDFIAYGTDITAIQYSLANINHIKKCAHA